MAERTLCDDRTRDAEILKHIEDMEERVEREREKFLYGGTIFNESVDVYYPLPPTEKDICVQKLLIPYLLSRSGIKLHPRTQNWMENHLSRIIISPKSEKISFRVAGKSKTVPQGARKVIRELADTVLAGYVQTAA